jgi:hypothetical protein
LGTGLTGTLPAQLALLSSLTQLVIRDNISLQGTIPYQLGEVTSLESVEIQGNKLTGGIPKELLLLVKTTSASFRIDGNQVSCVTEAILQGLSSCRV